MIRNTNQEELEDMKATGIVRRVDELGRLVIPKEIRRTMRLACMDFPCNKYHFLQNK